MKLGCALGVLLSAWLSSSATAGALRAPLAHFEFLGGESFDVRLVSGTARVQLAGSEYVLHRRPKSSLGQKFSAPGAVLIVDGTYAVFVTDHAINLDGCRSAEPIAVR